MTTCSATLIVKNEEANLYRCLQALQGLVHEIVVVDTGSDDGTVEIARAFTEHVHFFAWCDDFAAARNFAIGRATGDYVLSVDADEHLLDRESALSLIESFIHRYTPDVVGTVDIISAIGSGGDAQEVRTVVQRFFRRDRFRFEGAIHEQLVPVSGTKTAAPTGLRFSHSGYAHGPSSPGHKSHRNKRLLQAAIEKHPDDEYFWYQLGKAHVALSENAEACTALERALERIRFDAQEARGRTGPVAPEVLTDLIVSLAYAYVNTNQTGEAASLLTKHEALGHAGVQSPDFYHAVGYVYLMAGDVARSRRAYETSLRFDPRCEQVLGTGSFGSLYHLGLLREAEHDMPGACDYYRQCLRCKPDYGPAIARCIDFILEHKTIAPAEVWAACDPDALAERYRSKLYLLLNENHVDQATLLLQAASNISQALFEQCKTFLRELERETQPPSSQENAAPRRV